MSDTVGGPSKCLGCVFLYQHAGVMHHDRQCTHSMELLLWQAPARLIANNAGVEGDVIVEKLLGQPWEMGYNAMDDKIEDLLAAGIIDPAKVTNQGLLCL